MGRAYIVRAQGLDDLTPQIADEDRRKLKGQGQRGKEEIPDVLRRRLAKAGDREPMQRESEQQDEQDAEPEVGGRQREEEPDPNQLVGPAALVDGCDDAENERDDGRQTHGKGRKRERYRHPGQHEITDRLAIEERLTHVAMGEPRYEHPVLLEHRSIQTELLAKLRGLLVRRAVAEDEECRIARKDPDHTEDDDGDAEEDEGHQDKTSADVCGAAHISRSSVDHWPDG